MTESSTTPFVCPDTLEPLRLNIAADRLEASHASYPIRDGIPSFVSATLLEDQTIRSFAQKWSKHKYYRSHTAEFYTNWYLQRYGFHEADQLRTMLTGAKFILDAGTGMGRDAVNLASHSNATVFALDTAWEALSVARREVDEERVRFVHADINHLPFPSEFFDMINCDQVIHHTPRPQETFKHLGSKLKRGGRICCYVYRKKAVIREFVDDYMRDRISGLAFEEAESVCDGITKLGRSLSKLNATVEIEQDIPILGIKKGKMDVQRFIHWNIMKCFWNDEFDYFTNNVVNVDWYHPAHCHRYVPDEFRAWFSEGWEIEAFDVREAGISCRARKL
jgi:ubiquinone/menaquinone biosynthesis C-methylase UbiE